LHKFEPGIALSNQLGPRLYPYSVIGLVDKESGGAVFLSDPLPDNVVIFGRNKEKCHCVEVLIKSG